LEEMEIGILSARQGPWPAAGRIDSTLHFQNPKQFDIS
jgi:hypothetical protein